MTVTVEAYEEFIRAKVVEAPSRGFVVDESAISDVLFDFQRAIVRWSVSKGCAAVFASFGMGKTICALETQRLILAREGGKGLIVAPLGVRQEFIRDAKLLGLDVRFVRRDEEVTGDGIYVTNYESVRDGRLDPRQFVVVTLDEADCLRGFGGSKTFREFMASMAGDDRRDRSMRVRNAGVKYRFVQTATPSPNEFVELLAYSAFLGALDVGAAKTRFFKRDSTKADHLTIHPHKTREFWLWVSSWALFVTKPSDIDPNFDDSRYVLPEMEIHWHELPTDHSDAGSERDGQLRLVRDSALGVTSAAREKRDSLHRRIAKLMELRAIDPDAHRIIWHDLEDERRAIEAAIPDIQSVFGTQHEDERDARVIAFSNGETRELAGKPVMLGAGCNLQRHCAWAIYLGIGFKFRDFVQSIHRVFRFLQTKRTRIDLIYTDAEREVRRTLEQKWSQHNELVAQMTSIVREYGLGRSAMADEMKRASTIVRQEQSGAGWTLVNNCTVRETMAMESDSIGLICTSIPFAEQYEYSNSFFDFGHTDNAEHFFRQMDFLTPHLLRVLKPGRVAAIHVKDRVVPGGINGLSFQTVYPFHADVIAHFRKHGFEFLGMKTIVTDVVRENAQTYRLGWTEQCKDGSRMGVGMPEYLMLFRKPPTDASNGYADEPVVKDKGRYSRGRWQFDAHSFTRSSGNRLLTAEDLAGLTHDQVFKAFKHHSLTQVYDFEHDVALCDACDARGMLPTGFMLLQPQSWSDEVWTDVTRMMTLNSTQALKGREQHVCPLQLDIVDRVITQFSNKGDIVFDPFVGIGTTVVRSLEWERQGRGHELHPRYWLDGVSYCRAQERKLSMPTLFDIDAVTANDATGGDAE